MAMKFNHGSVFFTFAILLLVGSGVVMANDACPVRRELGQMLMVRVPPGPLNRLSPFKAQLRELNIGGVILFG